MNSDPKDNQRRADSERPILGDPRSIESELHASLAAENIEPLPDALKRRIESDIQEFEPKRESSWLQGFFGSPQVAWSVAAIATIMFAFAWFRPMESVQPGTLNEYVANQSEPDSWIRVELQPGSDAFSGASGWVEWNTVEQKGRMVLAGLDENTPTESQYQLWIVDPLRDLDFPIDAGVFDVQSGTDGSTTIWFKPRLPVILPKAFAITKERPGGIVKSRNEKPVMVGVI
jgi:hypothetical protein